MKRCLNLILFLTLFLGGLPIAYSLNFVVDSSLDEVDLYPNDPNNDPNFECETASNKCTLRAAIQQINGKNNNTPDLENKITLQEATYLLTIPGPGEAEQGDLDIYANVTIEGKGIGKTIIDANKLDRVFDINLGLNVKLVNLTITGGKLSNVNGGGIYNFGSTLTLVNCEVTGNLAEGDSQGGGIYSRLGSLILENTIVSHNIIGKEGEDVFAEGGGIYYTAENNANQLIIKNSLIHDNQALGETSPDLKYVYGGGILIYNKPATVLIENSTISGNYSTNQGGGVCFAGSDNINKTIIKNSTITNNQAQRGGGIYDYYYGGDSLFIEHSIVANNSVLPNGEGPDCKVDDDDIVSEGYNILGNSVDCTWISGTDDQIGYFYSPIDPKLGPLQDNGGPTWTHALLPDSTAIDAGDPNGCKDSQGNPLLTDQRGFPRESICDIGAYENTTCGNGIVEPDQGEQCDDGNDVDTDGCLETCFNAKCGDGHVQTGVEECDDGNIQNGDGCDSQCKIEQPGTATAGETTSGETTSGSATAGETTSGNGSATGSASGGDTGSNNSPEAGGGCALQAHSETPALMGLAMLTALLSVARLRRLLGSKSNK